MPRFALAARAAVGLVAVFAVVLASGAGCKQNRGPRVYVQPHYAPDADGLRAFWADVLDAAKKDDRDRVHDLDMATTLLSDADMKRLFGAKAEPLLPRYHMLMGNLINRGSVELVANVYDHKYDTVDAFAADDPTVAAAPSSSRTRSSPAACARRATSAGCATTATSSSTAPGRR